MNAPERLVVTLALTLASAACGAPSAAPPCATLATSARAEVASPSASISSTAPTASPSASASAAPSASASAPPALAPLVGSATIPVTAVPMKKGLTFNSTARATLVAAIRSPRGATIIPNWADARAPLAYVASVPAKVESAPSRARAALYSRATQAGSGEAWLVTTQASSDSVFAFRTIDRLYRLDDGGQPKLDVAWSQGPLAPRQIASDSAGGLYIAGTVADELHTSKSTITAPRHGRVEALVRLDSTGTIVWATALPGLAPQSTTALAVATDGTALVFGAAHDAVVPAFARVDPSGAVTAARSLEVHDTSGFTFPSSIDEAAPDGQRGFFVAGSVRSAALAFGDGDTLPQGAFIARLDDSDKLRWARALGDDLEGLAADAAGGALLGMRGASPYVLSVDADGAVTRRYDLALPESCATQVVEAVFGATSADLFIAATCQPFDNGYPTASPAGKATLFVGLVTRP